MFFIILLIQLMGICFFVFIYSNINFKIETRLVAREIRFHARTQAHTSRPKHTHTHTARIDYKKTREYEPFFVLFIVSRPTLFVFFYVNVVFNYKTPRVTTTRITHKRRRFCAPT